MSTDLRHQLGRLGEDLALAHLERLGCELVTRNHRTRFGEIDLIVRDGEQISPPHPAAAGRTVRAMAVAYLTESLDRPYNDALRFDAIGVIIDARGRLVHLEHLEAAF